MPTIKKTQPQNRITDTQALQSAASAGDLVGMAQQVEQLLRRVQNTASIPNVATVSIPQ